MSDHEEQSGFQKALNMFKYTYSCLLLIFSIVLVMGLIFTEQTNLSDKTHPAVAFIVLWVVIFWLSVVEGGQASIVGLAPVDRELYKDTHPRAYKISALVHKGDNLDRYLMGRQFLVIFIVFMVNFSGGPIADASLWDLPDWVINVFLVTGIAMILLTCMVGQLNSQVNASHCMLDYANDWQNIITLWICMAVEATGLMHSSYFIQMAIGWMAGKPIESNEPPKSGLQAAFFWLRVVVSFCILGMCLAVTFEALWRGETTMWGAVPPGASVAFFVVLLCIVGMLEGMQIAFFAVAKLRKEDRGSAKCALMTCNLLFKGKGRNLPGFMIGRQLTVVSCMFIVARVTSVTTEPGEGNNIFGVSDAIQNLFNTGLLGAVITTILGSITWQLVASAFPIAFLSNPLTYILLNIALFLEATGICSGAWVLAWIDKKIRGFQRDEVYIGTAEERAAKAMADHDENLQLDAGHPRKLPGFADTLPQFADAPESLFQLLQNDPAVVEYIEQLRLQKEEGTHGDLESGSEREA